mmetsp:Transcript_79237/g.169761  ORF Transcript_79237/g.169761 Transcript_79237/m.169761 type:complete len:760 (+) Transcript_79237:66-2345(+)
MAPTAVAVGVLLALAWLPAAAQMDGCNALCEYEGITAPCGRRVVFASTHRFKGMRFACSFGHELVMNQCESCRSCSLEMSGCADPDDLGLVTQDPSTPAVAPPKTFAAPPEPFKPATGSTESTKPYDCLVGLVHWRTDWSDPKKAWCCKHGVTGRGCPSGTTTSQAFDCFRGTSEDWAEYKRVWCCQHQKLGCLKFSYDCHAGVWNWEKQWSQQKKTWCCKRTGYGCATAPSSYPATTPAPKYDCTAGVANLEKGWSLGKKTWCCSQVGLGCSTSVAPYSVPLAVDTTEAVTVTSMDSFTAAPTDSVTVAPTDSFTAAPDPYDCEAGYNNWQQGWADGKKSWCCANEDKGCPPSSGGGPNFGNILRWGVIGSLLCCLCAFGILAAGYQPGHPIRLPGSFRSLMDHNLLFWLESQGFNIVFTDNQSPYSSYPDHLDQGSRRDGLLPAQPQQQDLFSMLDRNHDGVISRKEFDAALGHESSGAYEPGSWVECWSDGEGMWRDATVIQNHNDDTYTVMHKETGRQHRYLGSSLRRRGPQVGDLVSVKLDNSPYARWVNAIVENDLGRGTVTVVDEDTRRHHSVSLAQVRPREAHSSAHHVDARFVSTYHVGDRVLARKDDDQRWHSAVIKDSRDGVYHVQFEESSRLHRCTPGEIRPRCKVRDRVYVHSEEQQRWMTASVVKDCGNDIYQVEFDENRKSFRVRMKQVQPAPRTDDRVLVRASEHDKRWQFAVVRSHSGDHFEVVMEDTRSPHRLSLHEMRPV